MSRLIDLTGQVYGKITVLCRGEDYIQISNGKKSAKWVCQCECGNIVEVLGATLRAGLKTSCGCDRDRHKKRKQNVFENCGAYMIGHTPMGDFIIDTEDYAKVEKYFWYIGNDGYVRSGRRYGKKVLLLHRLILGLNDHDSLCTDHINHNRSDNRKQNLRAVSEKENKMNHPIYANNKSGVAGVWWDSCRKKWAASINEKGAYHYLGRFDSFDDAVAARKAAEERYFGEYSYDNSIAAVPRIAV